MSIYPVVKVGRSLFLSFSLSGERKRVPEECRGIMYKSAEIACLEILGSNLIVHAK